LDDPGQDDAVRQDTAKLETHSRLPSQWGRKNGLGKIKGGARQFQNRVTVRGPGMRPEPLHLVLPVPPIANKYWRSITINGQARVVLSKEARLYKRDVSRLLAGYQPILGAVAVTLRWFRERKTGDLDGRIKVLLDSLQCRRDKAGKLEHAGVLENDSQVVELHAYRAEDPARPRMEVLIESVGDVQLRMEA